MARSFFPLAMTTRVLHGINFFDFFVEDHARMLPMKFHQIKSVFITVLQTPNACLQSENINTIITSTFFFITIYIYCKFVFVCIFLKVVCEFWIKVTIGTFPTNFCSLQTFTKGLKIWSGEKSLINFLGFLEVILLSL